MKNIIFDIDGTLIKNDLFYEAVAILLKRPIYIFPLFLRLFKGKAALKDFVFQRVYKNINIDNLSYQSEVIAYMDKCRKEGNKIYLASGSHQLIVEKISKKFHCDGFFASDKKISLTGDKKAKVLEDNFPKGFVYVGNSIVDIAVWRKSNKAYLVDASPYVNRKVENDKSIKNWDVLCNNRKIFTLKSLLHLLRVKHYIKNFVIFVPLILHYGINFNVSFYLELSLIFIFISLLSSVVYIFNDILDIQSDRESQNNKNRPLAKADISIKTSFVISLLLLVVISFFTYWYSNIYFTIYVLFYLFLNLLYSFYFKHIFILNTILLSLFFIARLILGIGISDVVISPWLISFSFFFFYSLANIKKLAILKGSEKSEINHGEKNKEYILFLLVSATSSFYASFTLFFLFFTIENTFFERYSRPYFLMVSYFSLFIWFKYILIDSLLGKIKREPILYFLKKKELIPLLILIILGVLFAK